MVQKQTIENKKAMKINTLEICAIYYANKQRLYNRCTICTKRTKRPHGFRPLLKKIAGKDPPPAVVGVVNRLLL